MSTEHSSVLALVWLSTQALYNRFNLDAVTTPPAKRRRFFMEEVLEVIEASTDDERYQEMDAALCEEAADALVTLLGLVQSHNINLVRFQNACIRKCMINDQKTPENGYSIINGKISKPK